MFVKNMRCDSQREQKCLVETRTQGCSKQGRRSSNQRPLIESAVVEFGNK